MDAAEKAEQLAREAASRAAALALADSDRMTALAVKRAVKDAEIDRDLREHSRHLAEINGSQRDMAASLGAVKDSLKEMAVSQRAVSDYVKGRNAVGFSRRTQILAALSVLATYAGLLAALIAHG